MQIYLARNNQQAGPYSLEQINQMLASQQVLLTDLAWHQGMSEWKALGELTQGKLEYHPEGYQATVSTPAPFESPVQSTQQHTKTSNLKSNPVPSDLASIGSRVYAKVIDMLLWLPVFLIPALFLDPQKAPEILAMQQKMEAAASSDQVLQIQIDALTTLFADSWQLTLIYLLLMLGAQAYLLVKSGQSLGKKMAKIKIVDANHNGQVGFARIFVTRSLIFIILTLLAFPFVTIIDYAFAITSKRQTLHDKLAQTKVIKQA